MGVAGGWCCNARRTPKVAPGAPVSDSPRRPLRVAELPRGVAREKAAVDGSGAYTRGAMTIGIMGLGYVGPAARGRLRGGGSRRRRAGHRPAQGRRRSAAASPTSRTSPPSACAAVGGRIDGDDARYADLAAPTRSLICVPTPLTRNREPDLGAAAGRGRVALARVLQAGQLVVLESTTYPGHDPRAARRRCSRSPGLGAGRDFHVAFSPERVDPGRTDYTLRTTPKVVGGLTEACARPRRRALRAASATTSCGSRRPRRPS